MREARVYWIRSAVCLAMAALLIPAGLLEESYYAQVTYPQEQQRACPPGYAGPCPTLSPYQDQPLYLLAEVAVYSGVVLGGLSAALAFAGGVARRRSVRVNAVRPRD